MIKGCGYMRETHLIRLCLAQVENALIARIKPISETLRRRSLTFGEPYDLTIERFEPIHQLTWSAQIVMIETDRTHAIHQLSITTRKEASPVIFWLRWFS